MPEITGPSGQPLEGRKRLTPTKAFYLFESVKCRACGRTLRSDESIKRGFGPGCAVYFAGKYLSAHPAALGEQAKKKWTQEEVKSLISHATQVRREKGGGR